jgi:hypothetical protein
MFHKNYYKLDEVALALSMDVDMLFHLESAGIVNLYFIPSKIIKAY